MTDDLPGGQVTLADLFRVLSAMQSDMAKVATRLEVIDTRNKNADELHHDHETRLRLLESFKYRVYGAATVTGMLAGLVGAWIEFIVTHH